MNINKGTHVMVQKLSAVENPNVRTPDWEEGVRERQSDVAVSLPVDYTVKGYILETIEVGSSAVIDRYERNGVTYPGILTTSPVTKITPDGFETTNSVYRITEL